jgi:hypothetical protein
MFDASLQVHQLIECLAESDLPGARAVALELIDQLKIEGIESSVKLTRAKIEQLCEGVIQL